ncbi:CYFA0S01e14202g1_1 [Cyberlindnera fabianii]|uniref:CYFA0S01e14202g1_1 n=1 Tax=Cyberlindnera fabianii TaxID=36022 RepID=A0A061AJ88_CYBFA|nr:CYFA0S01e14202g1_1 [Cyberlindnera fabianii]
MTQPQPHRILYVGGSFGGMASIREFIRLFKEAEVPSTKQIEIFLIEPRAGFINLLGIPRAVIDVDFARKTYMNAEKYNINFSSVETSFPDVKEKILNAKCNEKLPENLKIHFIQGKCVSFVDDHTVDYQLEGDQATKVLKFDYCVFATGRRRKWPFDPVALTEDQYADEMKKSKAQVDAAQTITVIGGGALGIEIAGEVKETYPEKKVVLVHPHPFVPPEIYASKNFKDKLADGLESSGVELIFNTRIEKELENGDLITTDGRTLKSDLNMWCNYHKNNIEPLLPVFQDSIELDRSEVIVDNRLLMKDHKNIFCVGDVINARIIKTCGGAWHQGEHVAKSLFNILVKDKEEYDCIDIDNWPKGMTIVVGTHICITQWNNIDDGKIVFNDPLTLKYYQDYGCTEQRERLNIDH